MLIDLEGIQHNPDAKPSLKYGAAVKLWMKDLEAFVTAHSESEWSDVLRMVHTSARDFWRAHTQHLPTPAEVKMVLEGILLRLEQRFVLLNMCLENRPLNSSARRVARVRLENRPLDTSARRVARVLLRAVYESERTHELWTAKHERDKQRGELLAVARSLGGRTTKTRLPVRS